MLSDEDLAAIRRETCAHPRVLVMPWANDEPVPCRLTVRLMNGGTVEICRLCGERVW